MFKNYYLILNVGENATQEEIKSAFKRQALLWHPDRNLGKDTTIQMQEINEAYLILKDNDARKRYDLEFQRFKEYQKQKAKSHQESQQRKYEEQKEKQEQRQKQKEHQEQKQKQQQQEREQQQQEKEKAYEYAEFIVEDEILKKWMENAKRQAVELAKQTIEDFKGMVKVGTKEAAREFGNSFIAWTIFGIITFLIILLIKFLHS